MSLFCDKIPPSLLELETNWYNTVPLHYTEVKENIKNYDRVLNTLKLINSTITLSDFTMMPKIMSNKFLSEYNKYINSIKDFNDFNMNIAIAATIEDLKKHICKIFKLTDSILEDYIHFVLNTYYNKHGIQVGSCVSVLLYVLQCYINNPNSAKICDPYLVNIGKYNREERIGEGAYGKIFRVYEQTENDKIYYAEKVQKYLQLNEIDILFNHSHPNLLKGIDMFYLKDSACDLKHHIITQLAQYNLKYAIEKKTYKSNGGNIIKLSWCWDILLGLKYLHKKGIFHGDLKPDNILIIENRAVVADFSLSSSIDSELNYCGTPSWTSPEGLSEKYKKSDKPEYIQKLDYYASDMFSIGMIFAYIFSGKKIIKYDKDNIAKHYDDYIDNWITKITELKLPSKIEHLILNLCSPNISERWSCDTVLKYTVFSQFSEPENLEDSDPTSWSVSCNENYDLQDQDLKELIKLIIKTLKSLKVNLKIYYIAIDIIIRLWNKYHFNSSNYDIVCAASILIAGELMRSKEISTRKLVEYFNCSDKLLIGWYRAIPYHLEGKLINTTFYDIATSHEEKLWGLQDILEHNTYDILSRHQYYIYSRSH